MTFNKLEEAINWIENQIRFRPKTDLKYIKKAIKLLNFNLDKVKKIHVTGTNGKGSTCAYLTKALVDAGYQVGSFVSPYLVKFNERILLNYSMISDFDLLTYINKVYQFNQDYYKKYRIYLSFFELLFILSLIYFSDKQVDVLVIEVGIGGLLDATNALNYDLSLITSIDIDHTKQLGTTKEMIAYNKLGIVKKGNTLISTVDQSLYQQFLKHTKKVKANFIYINPQSIQRSKEFDNIFYYDNLEFNLNMIGTYQKNNAALAFCALRYLFNHLDENQIKKSIESTKYPGRMEEIFKGVYIDGAHNIGAINALIDTINHYFKNKKVLILFSALFDKDPKLMIDRLKEGADELVVTSFDDKRFKSLAMYHHQYIENHLDAFAYLLKRKSDDDIIIITGSIHFIGLMKKELLEIK